MFNRYFGRKHAWAKALNLEPGVYSRRQLRRATDERITKAYVAIVSWAEQIHDTPASPKSVRGLGEIGLYLDTLKSLAPYASRRGKGQIADGERTAAYASRLVPNPHGEGTSPEVTYYRVYIPSLDGHFYYLGLEEFTSGDLVAIPFGGENRIIYGIIREKIRRAYWEMPLPLWKMKYIASLAPDQVKREYEMYLKMNEG